MLIQNRSNESVFEKNLRKQKEKKKSKKSQIKDDDLLINDSESQDEYDDDAFFQQDFGSDFEKPVEADKENKKKDKKLRQKEEKKQRQNEEKSKAELELLLMDGSINTSHFSAKDVLKSEKVLSKKQKKKSKNQSLDAQPDFKMDLKDPRFAALISDHQFAIDPTNSQFKKTNAMKEILAQKRQNKNLVETKPETVQISEKNHLEGLIQSVKRKNDLASKNGVGKRQKL